MRNKFYVAILHAVILTLVSTVGCNPAGETRPQRVSAQRMLMGTTFQIQVVTTNARAGEDAIEAAFDEVMRVEELLSEWKTTSEISAVNRAAGEMDAIKVGTELYEIVERAHSISELTAGAFDITYASCGQLWSFRDSRIPTEADLQNCLPHVDYRRVELTPKIRGIRLPDFTMKIGISGIGKGYGVDRAAAILEEHGIFNYTVDGGGDLRVRGRNDDRAWQIGVADPRMSGLLAGTLELDTGAVVTSGDYHQYFDQDGKRYHHILDPRTGRPAPNSIAVTVVASSAMDADALATGLFVLGPENGLELVEKLPSVEALITGPDLQQHASSGFPGSWFKNTTSDVDAIVSGK